MSSKMEALMDSQSTLPKLSLDTLNINDINQLILALRYSHSASLIESKKPEDQPLQQLCKKLVLDYGSTHSYQSWKSGLFIDSYTREPKPSKWRNPRLLSRYGVILKHPELGHGLLVQDEPFFNELIKKKDVFDAEISYHRINYLGRPTGFLNSFSRDETEKVINKFFDTGLFQNKEMLLSSAAALDSKEFGERFSFLLSEYGLHEGQFTQQLLGLYAAKENSRQVIQDIFNDQKAWQENSRTNFYIGMLKKLFDGIPEIKVDDPQRQNQLNQSYNRLAFILEMALRRRTDKAIFLILLGYAFDEITFQKVLSSQYKADEVQSVLSDFIKNNNALDVSPTHVSLAGSGMHALTNAVYLAHEIIKEQKEFKIYIGKDTYFQIPITLRGFMSDLEWFTSDRDILISSGKPPKVENYKDQMIDMMICSFEKNPTLSPPSLESKNIDDDITSQLAWREKSGANKPLVVVIDMTASLFDDTRLSFLMLMHQEAIAAGKLAVIISNSLNKYFLTGFDKLPAGLNALFFDKKAFPSLQKWVDRPDYYGGFCLTDPTVQMITHCMAHANSYIHDFGHHIRGRARYVYERLVPKELLTPTTDSFLSIDSPYTTDLYKNAWGFLNIRMNCNRCRPVAARVMKMLEEACKFLGISYRDGYGYGYTTHLRLGLALDNNPVDMIRISIGMESTKELQELLSPLLSYVHSIDKIVRTTENANDPFTAIEKLDVEWKETIKFKESIDAAIESIILSVNQNKLTKDKIEEIIKPLSPQVQLKVLEQVYKQTIEHKDYNKSGNVVSNSVFTPIDSPLKIIKDKYLEMVKLNLNNQEKPKAGNAGVK